MLWAVGMSVTAQQKLSGRVVDAKTGEPLLYASIFLSDGPGTITNEMGEYEVKNPGTGYVKVQCLGYETIKTDIADFPSVVRMTPTAYNINTVTVTAIDINKLIQRLRSKYHPLLQNDEKYPNRMYFYRQTTSNNGNVNEIVEAFFKGQPNVYLHNLQLLQGRYAVLRNDSVQNRELLHSNFFDFSCIAPIGDSVKPWIKFINENWAKYYSVEIDVKKDASGGELYVMHFTPKKKVRKDIVGGTLYINPKSLLIYRYDGKLMNFHYDNVGLLGHMKNQCPTFSIIYDTESLLPRVKTVKVDEDYRFTYYLSLGKRRYDVKISSIMVAVDDADDLYRHFNMNDTRVVGTDDLADKIDEQPYDSLFWENNPIIKRTPLEESTTKIFSQNRLFGNYKNN